MFYMGNFALLLGLTGIVNFLDGLLYFINYGSYLDLSDLWVGLLFSAMGLFIIVYKFNSKHRHLLLGRVMGIFIIIESVFHLFSNPHGNYFATQIADFLTILIPGILIFIYNRKAKFIPEPVTPVRVEPEKNEKTGTGTDIDRLIGKLKEALDTKYALSNERFHHNLEHSIALLEEIQKSDYTIDEEFLKQIAKLTDIYLDLEDNTFQTKQSEETLNKIIQSFDTIDEALENIYDKNLRNESLDIEGDIIAMQTMLSMDGTLDSPFERTSEEKIENE